MHMISGINSLSQKWIARMKLSESRILFGNTERLLKIFTGDIETLLGKHSWIISFNKRVKMKNITESSFLFFNATFPEF